jgi:AraC-like DNA-binding protein
MTEIIGVPYRDWLISDPYILYVMQVIIAQIKEFVKYPSRQKPAAFNLNPVLRQLELAPIRALRPTRSESLPKLNRPLRGFRLLSGTTHGDLSRGCCGAGKSMPESVTAAFSEPEHFGAALRAEGYRNLVVRTPKQFRARLTQVTLNEIRLTAAEERVPRVAFVAVPASVLLILFSTGQARAPICAGMRVTEDEFVTVGPGEQFHARTDGASRWATIRLAANVLSQYSDALVDGAFSILPGMRRWRPPSRSARHIRSLHAAAMRMAAQHPETLVGPEAAHGLEQQLLHAVLECFSELSPEAEVEAQRRNQNTMLRFERALWRVQSTRPSLTEVCTELQVRERHLRMLCADYLGMSPTTYDRLRRMWLVRHTLRSSTSERVSTVARDNGFNDVGRFATNYRETFGELPSATLRERRTRSIISSVDC